MFIGRKYELTKLNEMYDSDSFQFAVIYGRRRVGKSTLINEFCKGKKAVYYMGVEASDQVNIQGLSSAVFNISVPGIPPVSLGSYEEIFSYIDSLVDERVILAIDEYPYMAESYRTLSSLIQKHIDEKWKSSKLMLILCGSSMSFMENQVLGYKSPLYGRRTAQFKINPFNYNEMKQFGWNYTDEQLAQIYGITGGIGEYVSFIDSSCTVRENIMSMYMEPSGRMFEEPQNLLKQELRDPKMYHSILNAIAAGKSSLNDIANKAGESSSACSYHLSSLISLGIVNKETPIGEKESSRKTIYSIGDSAFRFWYRFVFSAQSLIVSGNGEHVYENFIADQMNDFMGKIFEEMCLTYLMRSENVKNAPFPFRQIGRWWGGNQKTKTREEVDICAIDGDNLLLGECKWTNAKVDTAVLERLLERGELFPQENKFYILFSRSGFTTGVADYSKTHPNIRLVGLNEM